MTYYEELALAETASVDEIHKAYKRMTKLLHPDLQSDPELQALAGLQMKRLNAILSLLIDPARRRLYDQKITAPEMSSVVAPFRLLRHRVIISGLTYLSVGVGIGLIIPHPGPASRSKPLVITEVRPPTEPVIRKSYKERTNPSVALFQLAESKLELAETSGRNRPKTPAVTPPAAPAAAEEGRVEGAKTTVSRAEPEGTGAEVERYAGYWLYAPLKSSKGADSLYPPEYIEMKVAEKEGAIEGVYRARYRVADRPISPTVVFHFAGNATGSEPVFSWKGDKGARGEVKFKPLSENVIEVSWYTTEFAGDFAFGAGTAILMRRTD